MKNQWMAFALVAVLSALAGVAVAGAPRTTAVPPTITSSGTTTTSLAPAPETTVVTTTTAAEVTTTVETSTTVRPTTTTEPAPDAADIVVVAVNGAGTQGLATTVQNELLFFGFEQARATDGTTLVDDTVVYYFPGFEREAEEIARFFELDPSTIEPVADAPEFGRVDGDQVAVYIGRDRS